MNRRGVILAGGLGTRLYPITLGNTKQLLPVYDKPMIYYPISVLMLSLIREIAVICSPKFLDQYKSLLGDGSQFGISIVYFTQAEPKGLADAFIITEKFIDDKNVCLILGDNIFYGQGLESKILPAHQRSSGATIFSYPVREPSRFGVVDFDKNGNPISIEEKPNSPKSNFAVTGLYYYDNKVVEIAKSLKPSKRGEIEITDINLEYLNQGRLHVEDFGRGFAWLDMGTHDSLLEASQFIQAIEKQQGLKVACLEEIAFKNKWITEKKLLEASNKYSNSEYGDYILQILNKGI